MDLLKPRSGHSLIVNRLENTITLVGNSLSSLNSPIEMWSFNPAWSTTEQQIKQFSSADFNSTDYNM